MGTACGEGQETGRRVGDGSETGSGFVFFFTFLGDSSLLVSSKTTPLTSLATETELLANWVECLTQDWRRWLITVFTNTVFCVLAR